MAKPDPGISAAARVAARRQRVAQGLTPEEQKPEPPRPACVECGAPVPKPRRRLCGVDCKKSSIRARLRTAARKPISPAQWARKLAHLRERYANDHEYREKIRARNRERNRGRPKKPMPAEEHAEANAKRRLRYATDPEYCERRKAQGRDYRARRKARSPL